MLGIGNESVSTFISCPYRVISLCALEIFFPTKNKFTKSYNYVCRGTYIKHMYVYAHTCTFIFSTGIKEAGPNGLNMSDRISTGYMKEILVLCS